MYSVCVEMVVYQLVRVRPLNSYGEPRIKITKREDHKFTSYPFCPTLTIISRILLSQNVKQLAQN